MRHQLIGLVLALAGSCVLMAEETPSKSDALLQARIAQLETQAQQFAAEKTVCAAQLAIASQSATQQAQARQRAQIEKDAGCAIDWTATPPVCLPAKAMK